MRRTGAEHNPLSDSATGTDHSSKVWFTDIRTRPGHGLLDKTEAVMRAAGIANIDFKDKFVAI
ncbi:MAG: hypothetical protein ABFC79_00950, partial [Candidatus Cryosericum sp.]